MYFRALSSTLFVLTFALLPAQAEETGVDPIPFAGGNFTIVENDNMEKVLSFNGQELTRGYYVAYNQTADIGGTEVALFEVGPGGNACGPQSFLVWKPEGEALKTAAAGDECGSPPPAISDYAIVFVPYLLPGTTGNAQIWTPDEGMKLAGILSYAPQPGTTWATLNTSEMLFLVDLFSNEEVFADAAALLGDRLGDYVIGLNVSDGFHELKSGIVYGSGCVPHACGSMDSFIAVDKAGRKLYFAQQNDAGGRDSWPPLTDWPAEIRETMLKTIGG